MNKRKLITMLESNEITKDQLERLNVLNAARYSLLLACELDPGSALLMPEYKELTAEQNKRLHTANDDIMAILGNDRFMEVYSSAPIANQNIINDNQKIESYV